MSRDPEIRCRKCGALNRIWDGHADGAAAEDPVACGRCGAVISIALETQTRLNRSKTVDFEDLVDDSSSIDLRGEPLRPEDFERVKVASRSKK